MSSVAGSVALAFATTGLLLPAAPRLVAPRAAISRHDVSMQYDQGGYGAQQQGGFDQYGQQAYASPPARWRARDDRKAQRPSHLRPHRSAAPSRFPRIRTRRRRLCREATPGSSSSRARCGAFTRSRASAGTHASRFLRPRSSLSLPSPLALSEAHTDATSQLRSHSLP